MTTDTPFDKLEAKMKTMKVSPKKLSQLLGLLSIYLIHVRSGFHHEMIGKVPKDILQWVRFGREQFPANESLMEILDNIELKVYKEANSKVYWDTSQKILNELKPPPSYTKKVVSYKEFQPIDYRDVTKDYNPKLLKALRNEISGDCLSNPVGKGWAKGRQKRDDLSPKNWPLIKRAMVNIYEFLFPFYPPPMKKKGGTGRYSSELADDIATLMRDELSLNDITRKDVNSAIQYYCRRNRAVSDTVLKSNPDRYGKGEK